MMEPKIIYENSDFYIIEKPTGWSCHNDEPSILKWLKGSAHFVSRLDRETSGLLLIAKSDKVHHQFQSPESGIHKKYLALLRGQLTNPSPDLMWNFKISDQAEGYRNPAGTGKLYESKSLVKALTTNKYFSLVEVTLQTGYQHQIRKQAALSKHPIVGDERYNEKKYNLLIQQKYPLQYRLFLHASHLSFTFNNKKFEFTSPCEFEKMMS